MRPQSYANHARVVIGFHVALFTILLLTTAGSIVGLFHALDNPGRLYHASLLAAMSVSALMMFWYMRAFPLRAQDRAIRAEENFRHFVLAGQRLDTRLTMRQIIALRFASDEEFVALAARAAAEGLAPDTIKQQIKTWRPDYHRA